VAEKQTSTRKSLRPFRIPPLSIHWLRYLLTLILLALAVHLILPQLATIEGSLNTVRNMKPGIIGAAVLVEVASYVSAGYVLAALAATMGDHLAIRRGMTITLAGNSIGLVAGGVVGTSAVVYRWTRNSGVGREGAALCGALPFVFLNLILVLLSIVGIIQLFIVHQLTTLEAVAFGLTLTALIIIGAGVIFGMSHPTWLSDRVSSLGRRWARWRKKPFDPEVAENLVARLVDTWIILINGGWRGPFFGATMMVLLDMAVLGLVFAAAGHPVTLAVLLAGYGLPMLIGRLPIVPGGVGIVEAMMIAVFTALNVPQGVAVIATVGFRLISFWGPTLTGFPLAVYLQQTTSEIESPA
jgi:uncharacterized protein (TIRG00374 family)